MNYMRKGTDFDIESIVDTKSFGAHPMAAYTMGGLPSISDLWGDIYSKGQEALLKEADKLKNQAVASGAALVGSAAQSVIDRPEVQAAALESGKAAALEATAAKLQEGLTAAQRYASETASLFKKYKMQVAIGAGVLVAGFVAWRILRKKKG